MKKVFLIVCALQFLASSCVADTFDFYKDEFRERVRDPNTRVIKGNENDVNDLEGCPVLFEMGKWDQDGRDQSWFTQEGIYHSTGVALDLPTERGYKNLNIILQDKSQYLVYIGPWRPITLTHTEGSFLNKKEIKEEKQIRFFAYQSKDGGKLSYQYESMTEDNKSIPEKPFSLSPARKYAPDKFSLCAVKWTAKYGYNAVIDLHQNPWWPYFSKEYLVGSGKIIEAKE